MHPAKMPVLLVVSEMLMPEHVSQGGANCAAIKICHQAFSTLCCCNSPSASTSPLRM